MDIRLVIAILALLTLALLPVLDRFATPSEIDAKGLRSYVVRMARWTKE
jgi:hypothetical protein